LEVIYLHACAFVQLFLRKHDIFICFRFTYLYVKTMYTDIS